MEQWKKSIKEDTWISRKKQDDLQRISKKKMDNSIFYLRPIEKGRRERKREREIVRLSPPPPPPKYKYNFYQKRIQIFVVENLLSLTMNQRTLFPKKKMDSTLKEAER